LTRGRATRNDRDEVSVPRVVCGERCCNPARARIADREAVCLEDVAQTGQRLNIHVLPRLATRPLAGVQGEPVPDRPNVGDIRQRERLVAEGQRSDVVPAREVLRAHDGDTVRSKDTAISATK
jgi:hypothetical protein